MSSYDPRDRRSEIPAREWEEPWPKPESYEPGWDGMRATMVNEQDLAKARLAATGHADLTEGLPRLFPHTEGAEDASLRFSGMPWPTRQDPATMSPFELQQAEAHRAIERTADINNRHDLWRKETYQTRPSGYRIAEPQRGPLPREMAEPYRDWPREQMSPQPDRRLEALRRAWQWATPGINEGS